MEDMTRKIKSLFNMKDMNLCPSCKYIRLNVHVVKRMLGKLSETWKYVGLSTRTPTKNQNH